MEKIQKQDLYTAASALKRAQSAKEAMRGSTVQDDKRLSIEEMEAAFQLAQDDAEKAFQALDHYSEKIEATSIRIEAVLGRCGFIYFSVQKYRLY